MRVRQTVRFDRLSQQLSRLRFAGLHPRFSHQEGGTALVETAVTLPAFTLLLFGIFQFSMAITSYLGCVYTIRSVTRYAGMHSLNSGSPASVAQLQTMVLAGSFIPQGSSTVVSVGYFTYVGSSSGNLPGNVVAVSVQYPQSIIVPFYGRTFTMSTITYRLILH